MSQTKTVFGILAHSVAPEIAASIEELIETAPDSELNRINVFTFGAKTGHDVQQVISAFLHAARLGIFDMSWNVLCPGCGGVLQEGAVLKTVNRDRYNCSLCSAGYEPTLDEMVEVTFTVNPRTRRIAAHDPDTLPMWDYARQIFFSSGVDLPAKIEPLLQDIVLDAVELPPGDRAFISLQLPREFVIVFDPVTHATQFIDVQGEVTRERQAVSVVLDGKHVQNNTIVLHPGPLRLSFENRTDRRVLPALWIAGDHLHELLGRRTPFLTAKRLLTNQTFRDLYRTETLDVDQRLKITSLTFLFTDLKGSTTLYERVGDLVAYDLVRAHFRMLAEIVDSEAGAVVKTIGDAVMATFHTPDRALAAALRMRDAMRIFNEQHKHGEILLKIGIHEGPCLAVSLNDRQDYFGQTVNIASRVQNLSVSQSIFATSAVTDDPQSTQILAARGIAPKRHEVSLRGLDTVRSVYEIP